MHTYIHIFQIAYKAHCVETQKPTKSLRNCIEANGSQLAYEAWTVHTIIFSIVLLALSHLLRRTVSPIKSDSNYSL